MMPDEMFFSGDEKSLVRGKRVARRTDTCRPCLVKLGEIGLESLEGVVLDITPHGMLVRTVEALPLGTPVQVQLMRDENFERPLAEPKSDRVVRQEVVEGEFVDHGIELVNKPLKKQPTAPLITGSFDRKSLDLTAGGPIDLS